MASDFRTALKKKAEEQRARGTALPAAPSYAPGSDEDFRQLLKKKAAEQNAPGYQLAEKPTYIPRETISRRSTSAADTAADEEQERAYEQLAAAMGVVNATAQAAAKPFDKAGIKSGANAAGNIGAAASVLNSLAEQQKKQEFLSSYRSYNAGQEKSGVDRDTYDAGVRARYALRTAEDELEKTSAEVQALNSEISRLGDPENYTPQSDAELSTLRERRDALSRRTSDLEQKIPAQKKALERYENESRYSRLSANADYAAKSRYQPTEQGKDLYDYINRNEEAVAWQTAREVEDGRMFAGTGNSYLQQMTDDEIANYNYLYATEGASAADEYIDYITPTLNARQRQADERSNAEYATEHPVKSSVFSVLSSPLKGVSYAGQAADYLDDGTIDQNAGYNRFSYENTATRNAVSDVVEKNWGKVGTFLYQTGMSMGDFLLNTAITGGFSGGGAASENLALAIMGTGAAADATIEAKDSGMSDSRAFTVGTIAGLAEIVTEKVSLETLLDKTSLSKSALGYWIKNVVSEGSEEVASDAINLLADVLVARDEGEWARSIAAYRAQGMDENTAFWHAVKDQAVEMGIDFAGGALSGGVMAGAPAITQGIRSSSARRSEQQSTANAAQTQQSAQNAAQTTVPGAQTAQQAQQTAPAAQTQQNVPAAQTQQSATSAAQTQTRRGMAARLDENGKIVIPTAAELYGESMGGFEQSEYDSGTSESLRASLDVLGSVTGNIYRFIDEIPLSGGGQANGMYDGATVWISRGAKKPLEWVAAHETGHILATSAPDAWAEFSEYALGKKGEQELRNIYELYSKYGIKTTLSSAKEELASNYLGDILGDENTLRSFTRDIERGRVQRSTAQKIVDAIQNFFAKIRGRTTEQLVAKQLGITTKEAEKAVGLIKNAIAAADARTSANAQAEQGTAQYSLQKTEDGQKYADIDVDQHLFDGLSVGEMANMARRVILERFRGKVIGTDYRAYVNRNSAREYSHPANRRQSDETKQAKMRASTELDTLMEASVFRENQPDDGRHPEATGGWDKLDTLFRVGGRMFSGEISVMVTDKGKVFYDLTKIKDITSRTNGRTSEDAPASRSNASTDSITDPATDVKPRFSLSEPVEQTRDFVALHNVSEENLLKSIRLGGLPAPSIAVTTPERGHSDFGEISLVFGRDTVDPEANSRNKIYGRDAGTPTVPRAVMTQEAREQADALDSRIYDLAMKAAGNLFETPPYDRRGSISRILSKTDTSGAAAKALSSFSEVQSAYLASRGQTLDLDDDATVAQRRTAAVRQLEKRVNRSEVEAWIEPQIAELYGSGKRALDLGLSDEEAQARGFSGRYTPYTAENIVKAMFEEGTSSADTEDTWAFRLAKGAREFSGVEDARSEYSRLSDEQMDEDEYDSLSMSIQQRLYEIADRYGIEGGINNPLTAAARGEHSPEAITEVFAQRGIEIDEDDAEEVLDIIYDIETIPVKYFEAKPERVVPFSEAKAAILPRRASQEVRDALNSEGVPVVEYDGTSEDRLAKLNSLENVRFSLSDETDSEGSALSAEQVEFFKDSTVRDESGRLMVVYHQTENEFTVFDPQHKGAGTYDEGTPFGIFMKSSPVDIGIVGDIQMPLYANIKNPLYAEDRADLTEQLRQMSTEYAAIIDEYEDAYDDYEHEDYVSDRKLEEFSRKWFEEHPYASSTAIYKVAEYRELEAQRDASLAELRAKRGKLARQAKEVLTAALRTAGYDGIILAVDEGSFDRSTDAYIALDANQVKNVDNRAPTSDPDIRYSLGEYSEHQKQNWAESRSIVIYESEEQLKQFISDALEGKNLGQKMYFGTISTDLAARIEAETGAEVEGYNCSIAAQEIRKILLNSHGDEQKENLRGQRAITEEDIASIPTIIQSPDEITLDSKLYKGKPVIHFVKTLNGKTTVVSYVSDKHHDLTVQTMYSGKNKRSLATGTDEQASVNTPETLRGTASSPDSITDPTTDVKPKYSLKRDRSEIANREGITENDYTAPDTSSMSARAEQIENAEIESEIEREEFKNTGRIVVPTAADEVINKLPKNAQSYLKRVERKFVRNFSEALGVPRKNQSDFLNGAVREMCADYLSAGQIQDAALENLFNKAYDAGVVVDREYYNQYKHIRDHIRKQAVSISAEDSSSIPDYKYFVAEARGDVRIVKSGGLPVDMAYQELNGMAPELFPESITHPADQLERMVEVSRDIRISRRTLDEAAGEDAATFRKWARNDFGAAAGELIQELRLVKRYAEDAAAQTAQRPAPRTVEEAQTSYAALRAARRELAKIQRQNLLTREDTETVGKLMRGETSLQQIEGSENYRAIKAVYEAKQEYETIAAELREYSAALKASRRAEAEELLTTSAGWKDKAGGILYSRETMERNVRDIVPDAALAERIIAKYFTPVHTAEAAATRMKNEYRDRVRALDLSRKVKKGDAVSESHAAQLYGEASDNIRMLLDNPKQETRDGMTLEQWRAVVDELWAQNPGIDKAKIESAVEEFRKIYDELFGQMNEVRVRNGYEPISYRRGYFPHFEENGSDGLLAGFAKGLGIEHNVTALPTQINGMTHTFRPGITWFSHALERVGWNTVYDAVEGFDRYIEGAAAVIYQTDNIQNLRALASQIRYRSANDQIKQRIADIERDSSRTEDEKQLLISKEREGGSYALSNFVVELDEYTNLLAGKRSSHDRPMEADYGRGAYNFTRKLMSRVGANMVAANISSAVTNFIPLTQGWSMVSSKNILSGMWDTIKAMISPDGFSARSTFLTNRKGSDPLVRSTADSISQSASMPMTWIDEFTAESLVRARYQQNRKKCGLSEEAALSEADAWAAGLMADRSKGSTPTLFSRQNPLAKALTQFQLEVNNQLSFISKDMKREIKNKSYGGKQIAAMVLKMLFGAWAYNELYELIFGRRPALDPAGMIIDFVEDIADKDVSFGDALKNLGEEAGGELPFVGGLVFEGGRLPVSSAMPDFGNLYSAMTNSDWAANKRWSTAAKELAKPIYYILAPFGGGQMKKIIEGMTAVAQGGSYSLSSDGEKQLQYPVFSDGVWGTIGAATKALLFGKSSFASAQNWVDSGFKSLNADATATYLGLRSAGMKDRDAYNTVKTLLELDGEDGKHEKAERRLALGEADMTGETKYIVYRGMLSASDKERETLDTLIDMGADSGDLADTMLALHLPSDLLAVEGADIEEDEDAPSELSLFVAAMNGERVEREEVTEEDEEDSPEIASLKREAILSSNLSPRERAVLYYGSAASTKDKELMDDLADGGADMGDAGELIMRMKDAENSAAKYDLIRESDLKAGEKETVCESVMADSTYEKMKTALAAGVPTDTYLEYLARLSELTSDRDENGNAISGSKKAKVLKLINSLGLSAAQKDTLYIIAGYGESTIDDAPWR